MFYIYEILSTKCKLSKSELLEIFSERKTYKRLLPFSPWYDKSTSVEATFSASSPVIDKVKNYVQKSWTACTLSENEKIYFRFYS
jgi:hypothetical protein